MASAVSYRLDGDVAMIGIDDGKANALSPDVITSIDAALDKAQEARAVVLHGRPGRFSAGFDLTVMTGGAGPMRALVGQGAELLLRIFTFPVPVVAAGTGHALAAGALLLLAADRRVGAEGEYKIGLNEVAIGMALPIFAVELARYRLGPRSFDNATVHANIYDPAGAVEAGYLDRLVPADRVIDEALAEATHLGGLRAGAFRITKMLAHEPTTTRIRDTLADDLAQLAPPPG